MNTNEVHRKAPTFVLLTSDFAQLTQDNDMVKPIDAALAARLTALDLDEYADAFSQQGLTKLEDIVEMSPEELEEVAEDVQMTKWERKRFVKKIAAEANPSPAGGAPPLLGATGSLGTFANKITEESNLVSHTS